MRLTIAQTLQQGVAFHEEGRFQDAERLYRAILRSQPTHPDANHNLGVLLASFGRAEDALPLFEAALEASPKCEQFWLSYIDALMNERQVELVEAALEKAKKSDVQEQKLSSFRQKLSTIRHYVDTADVKPIQALFDRLASHYRKGQYLDAEKLAVSITRGFPEYQFGWKVLSAILMKTGRIAESLSPGQKSIYLAPHDAEAHNNLGVILKDLGEYQEAEKVYRQAIALRPDYAEAHSNLGNTLQKLERMGEAEASYRKAIGFKPDFAEAHANLGNTLKHMGRSQEAVASYSKALVLNPRYTEAHSSLGSILQEQGRLDEAIASYKQALVMEPNYAEAHFNLGNALSEAQRLAEAEVSYTQAIIAKPDYAEAYYNLAITLQEIGKAGDAESNYKKAIAFNPDYPEAHNNLGNTMRELGRFDDAASSYSQAIKLNPWFLKARSNLLFLIASIRFDAVNYLEEAKAYSDIVAGQISSQYSQWSSMEGIVRLRVGFVSGDFKQHPVGYFLEGLLRQLQSSSVELYAYTTNNLVGEFTERLKGLFHSWISIAGQSDKDAAQNIHNDGIHVLIDLSGHTSQNRLPIFGWKPAPIQISWLGYFASTGLPEIDYILGDPYVTPESEAHHYIEKIWQLPGSYLCFTAPDTDLTVGPLPALTNGFLTFGCFNSLSRMTDEVVSVRAEILHAVSNSKLFLKDKRLDHKSGRDQILSRFAAHGIDESRLLLEGRSSREEYLACYHRVDIALSPFPYGGGTTSIEGLWMGVPVITKAGTYFLSHLGESIAYNTNLQDWIAADNRDYVAKAVHFSSDLSTLDKLRRDLRKNLLKTPLFDLESFALNFEKALWDMKDALDHQK